MPLGDVIQQRKGLGRNPGLSGVLAQREEEKGLLEKTGDFSKKAISFLGDVTGVKAIGEATKEYAIDKKSVRETFPKAIGGAAKLGLTLGSFGTGAALTVPGRIAQGAATGAGFGLAESVEKGKGAKETLFQTGTGAALGAIIPITFEGVRKGQQVLLPKISRQLERINLRLTPNQRRTLGTKLDDVADFMRKKKIVGTPAGRFDKVDRVYQDKEKVLDSFLRKDLKDRTIAKDSVIKSLNNVRREFANERDVLAINKQIDSFIETIKTRYPSSIPAWKLNALKRSTYQNAFNKAGDKVLDDVEFSLGDKLKDTIELIAKGGKTFDIRKIQNQTLDQFNKEYGTVITARKLLKIAESRNQLGAFGRLISAIMGGSIGGATGGPVGVGVGALAGEHLGKLFVGTPTRSLVGATAQRLSEVPTKRAGEVARKFLTPIISR